MYNQKGSDNIAGIFFRINTNLNIIKGKIATDNKTNDFSLNLFLETTALKIYNIIFDKNAINANLASENFPGVDGIDIDASEMIQVTSSYTMSKIDNSIEQVIKYKHYEKYNRLKIILLKDINIKKDRKKIKDRIAKIINGKFLFDIDVDIIDLDQMYRHLKINQNLSKAVEVLTILDNFLEIAPDSKFSAPRAISITFGSDEITNVCSIVNYLTREQINVYTSSKELYDQFRVSGRSSFDYLIYVSQEQMLRHISHTIVVLSNIYITNNIQGKDSCLVLNHLLLNRHRCQVISFNRFLKNLDVFRNLQLGVPKTLNVANIDKRLRDSILKDLFAESMFSTLSYEDVKEALINTYSSFNNSHVDEKEFYLIKFVMDHHPSVFFNLLVLKKDYVLQRLERQIKDACGPSSLQNLTILAPKDFNHRTATRIDNIRSFFPSSQVYYIDEFLFDKSFKFEQSLLSSIPDYVDPDVLSNGDYLGINDVIDWIINDNESMVGIIKAAGGIGKTTFCEKIHDKIVSEHTRFVVAFIDSSTFIQSFKNKRFLVESDYDLYAICKNCYPDWGFVSERSFFLNFALGNIVVIFDGVDEIISTIPSFDLSSFLIYVETLRKAIGRGKIIINCRDTYIEEMNSFFNSQENTHSVMSYELLGFDIGRAELYFRHHFDDKKVLLCKRILKEFYPDVTFNQYSFPPFVLDIIVQIVKSNFNFSEIDFDFNSDILCQEDSNDFLMYRILRRETYKKNVFGFNLSIDDQVRFLCFLAVDERGSVYKDGLLNLLNKIRKFDRGDNIVKGLQDHPLLTRSGQNLVFRFPFLNTYFKAIMVTEFLFCSTSFATSQNLVQVLSYDCNINSEVARLLTARIRVMNNNFELLVKRARTCIGRLREFGLKNDYLLSHVEKSISNLFLILVASFSNRNSNELIRGLFSKSDGVISNFCLIDVPASTDLNLDFSDLYFSESRILRFADFFNCKVTEETYFDDTCEISEVYSKRIDISKINASAKNFDSNIRGDNSVFKVLTYQTTGHADISRFFRQYLSYFLLNRQLVPVDRRSIQIDSHNTITIDTITTHLENGGIIEVDKSGFSIHVNRNFHSNINRFLSQGRTFLELNRAIRSVVEADLSGNEPDRRYDYLDFKRRED
ncbi:hypothetical protein GCM10007423_29080 [Dyadobacter endophyticus]|uniref:SMEK domain-containing protein n=1 Tax=Dyadobacter endophyticus TaxID=1749036 RepID=A0ABQ1YU51_9BACT|nr:SMEK domain-containing protein [Dyadobacter endophyticus]GGH36659.1 hypothetical protein GCM10007423_29080 [Dyadobacter endophyticus]